MVERAQRRACASSTGSAVACWREPSPDGGGLSFLRLVRCLCALGVPTNAVAKVASRVASSTVSVAKSNMERHPFPKGRHRPAHKPRWAVEFYRIARATPHQLSKRRIYRKRAAFATLFLHKRPPSAPIASSETQAAVRQWVFHTANGLRCASTIRGMYKLRWFHICH